MKKASISLMLILVIVIVVMVGIAVIWVALAPKLFSSINREMCRNSIAAQSAALDLPMGEKIFSPDCKTYPVTFYDTRVEINGKTTKVYDPRVKKTVAKFNGLTDDIVNRVMAEELRYCWYQFLEGKKPILDKRNRISVHLGALPRVCLVCDEFSFDKSVKQQTFNGFYDYTKNTKMLNSNMTYYQYFAEQPRMCEEFDDLHASDDTRNCWEYIFDVGITPYTKSWSPETTVFNKDDTYATVFLDIGYKKKSKPLVAIGPNDVDFFSYVFPSSSFSDQCTEVWRWDSAK
jgi:hypothetical protein